LVAAGIVAIAGWVVIAPRTPTQGSLLLAAGGIPAYLLFATAFVLSTERLREMDSTMLRLGRVLAVLGALLTIYLVLEVAVGMAFMPN
jgi:hypothetical protein